MAEGPERGSLAARAVPLTPRDRIGRPGVADESTVPTGVGPISDPPRPPPWRPGRRALGILLLGFLIREAFSFWTGHPYDFEVWVRTGYVVAHGHNPYRSFWGPVPGASFAFLGQTLPSAAYLPFWPVTLGLLYRLWELVGGGNRFVLYFLLKQPTILADVASAYALGALAHRWSGDPAMGDRAVVFWSLFPYAIVVSAIWGQFDAFLVLAVVGILVAGTALRRSVLEGVGAFVKLVTVVLAPLELLRARGTARLSAFLVVLLPLALTGLSFWLAGWSLVGVQDTTAAQGQGGGGGMNLAQFIDNPSVLAWATSVPDLILVLSLLWIPAVLLASWPAARWARTGTAEGELRAVLFVLIVFLTVRWGLNEQYMVYIFALVLIDVLLFHPGRWPWFYALMAMSSAFLIVNNDLGLWFLSPVSTTAFAISTHVDQATALGGIRADALVAIAVGMTVVLLLWIEMLWRGAESPRILDRWRRRRGDPAAPV